MRGWNWLAKCPPFFEQRALAEPWGELGAAREVVMDDALNQALQTPLNVLHCPTRRAMLAYPIINAFCQRYGEKQRDQTMQ